MPSRKQSGSASSKQAEWQLRILQTAVEARPVRLEFVVNMMWVVVVFSLGGLATWFGTSGAGWTFQGVFFFILFLLSGVLALAAIFLLGKQNDKFMEHLIFLSRGTPLPQATLERIIRGGKY